MKYNVSFKLDLRKGKNGQWIEEKVPINAKISFAGDRLNYFTGYRIDKCNFDIGGQIAKKNTKAYEGKREVSYSDVNRRFKNIEAALTILFDTVKFAPDKATIINTLDNRAKKTSQVVMEPEAKPLLFFPLFANYIENSRLSEGRTKLTTYTMKKWQRFADQNKLTLTLDLVTPDLLRAFEKYLLSEKKTVNGKEVAVRGINTIHTKLKVTRAFINHTIKELKLQGITIPYPFDSYTVPVEVYGTPIYLTLNERNLLFDAEIKNDQLAQVRDIFIFQCLVGCRIGDLRTMTKSNINNSILSYIPRKTKEGKPVTVTVPLTAKAIQILSRYDIPDGRILPFLSNQQYNTSLKLLFEEVGLTRMVTRQHPTTRESENVRLCDIASSHMARRSFVGNLFGKVDSAIIASMSGHVTNSKAFARYYDVSKELQRTAIDLLE
jgi:integrase